MVAEVIEKTAQSFLATKSSHQTLPAKGGLWCPLLGTGQKAIGGTTAEIKAAKKHRPHPSPPASL